MSLCPHVLADIQSLAEKEGVIIDLEPATPHGPYETKEIAGIKLRKLKSPLYAETIVNKLISDAVKSISDSVNDFAMERAKQLFDEFGKPLGISFNNCYQKVVLGDIQDPTAPLSPPPKASKEERDKYTEELENYKAKKEEVKSQRKLFEQLENDSDFMLFMHSQSVQLRELFKRQGQEVRPLSDQVLLYFLACRCLDEDIEWSPRSLGGFPQDDLSALRSFLQSELNGGDVEEESDDKEAEVTDESLGGKAGTATK
jgi:hypothetical protein